MKTVDVAAANELSIGSMHSFQLEGKNILVANVAGKYCAINGVCTHLGGDLSKGKLEGKIVTCPRHGSQFDVTTGECVLGPKIAFIRLKTKQEPVYEVKVDGGRILINI